MNSEYMKNSKKTNNLNLKLTPLIQEISGFHGKEIIKYNKNKIMKLLNALIRILENQKEIERVSLKCFINLVYIVQSLNIIDSVYEFKMGESLQVVDMSSMLIDMNSFFKIKMNELNKEAEIICDTDNENHSKVDKLFKEIELENKVEVVYNFIKPFLSEEGVEKLALSIWLCKSYGISSIKEGQIFLSKYRNGIDANKIEKYLQYVIKYTNIVLRLKFM